MFTKKTKRLTEAAFFIVEVMFPLRNGCPGLVHDEVVVRRAAVAVLARHPGQTDTLPGLWVTTSANGKLRVAATPLTALRPEVPEPVETSLALLSRHAGLAGALAGDEVALGKLTGLAAAAGQTAVRPVLVKAPVVSLALVTAGPLHPGQTATLPSLVITLTRPVQVAVTRPAVLQSDGVTVEPRLAPLAVVARSVPETELTQARHSVTGIRVLRIDVIVALTGLAETAGCLRLAKVSWATVLTLLSHVVRLTLTNLSHRGRSGWDVAGDGKTRENY